MARNYEDRWKIVGNLPQGGQAYVHKVIDKSGDLESEFVLKRLMNSRRLARFEEEVAALQQLDHPGITKLLDFDLDTEEPWFVQEYCDGGDLDTFVSDEKIENPEQAFQIFIDLCNALAYAHEEPRSRVHRDIKPANIFLRSSDGSPVLGDFGLTFHAGNESERITLTDEQVGSRYFMAPELRDGRLEDPTPSCDIYSLGKVLYFMLSGGVKFDRENFDDDRYDIVRQTGNVYLEHANNLFRKMIVFDPGDRLPASELVKEAMQAKDLVKGEYPSLTGRHLSPCKYCGQGMYEPVSQNLTEYAGFFGFTASGINTAAEGLQVMMCNKCGHVQVFKIKRPISNWWPSKE